MNPLVSVVVPIYNVESFLDISIPSIMNQSYANLEIILVDDGSTDHSLEKCWAYKEKDERIVVIHKANGGVSSARNRGLDEAQGEYLVFVDADDLVEKKYVEILMDKHAEYPDSIIKCGMKHALEGGIPITETEFGNAGLYRCSPGLDISNKYDFACVYGKLFAMKYINGSLAKERFDESIHYGEDYLFCVRLFLLHGSMYVLEDRLYHCISREGSAVRTFNQKRFTEIRALKGIEAEVRNYPIALHSIRQQIANRAFDILYLSKVNPGVLTKEQVHSLKKTMRHYMGDMFSSKQPIKRTMAYCIAAVGM